jgi:hypothetical protein
MRKQIERNIEKLFYDIDELVCQMTILEVLSELDKNEAVEQEIEITIAYLISAANDLETLYNRVNNDLFYLLLTTPHRSHYRWFESLNY